MPTECAKSLISHKSLQAICTIFSQHESNKAGYLRVINHESKSGVKPACTEKATTAWARPWEQANISPVQHRSVVAKSLLPDPMLMVGGIVSSSCYAQFRRNISVAISIDLASCLLDLLERFFIALPWSTTFMESAGPFALMRGK